MKPEAFISHSRYNQSWSITAIHCRSTYFQPRIIVVVACRLENEKHVFSLQNEIKTLYNIHAFTFGTEITTRLILTSEFTFPCKTSPSLQIWQCPLPQQQQFVSPLFDAALR